MTFNVGYDIDQVLCFHHVKNTDQGAFFLNKGAIETALETHYIYPGAIESIRLLSLTPDVRLTFYSAGSKERNEILVPRILDRALPEPEYEQMKSRVRILSREDLVYSTIENLIYNFYQPLNPIVSECQKDLTKILHSGDFLENAVLIDDQLGNAAWGQVTNLLAVPVSEEDEYDSLLEKTEAYNPVTGTRFLKCIMNMSGVEDLEEDLIQDGRRIFIYSSVECFDVKFVDLSGRICEARYNKRTSPEVFKQLDLIYLNNLKTDEDLIEINDYGLVEKICTDVMSLRGRGTKICRRANRICYVMGVLFLAITHARLGMCSLSQGLTLCQYKLNPQNGCFEPNFHKSQSDDKFYHLGLAMLKTVNSSYEFINPHNYRKYCQVTASDLEFLQYAKENEYERES